MSDDETSDLQRRPDQASDLRKRLEDVERREREVARREEGLAAKGLRRNLYDRVNLSIRAVDAIIIACVLAIVILIAVGLFLGRSPQ